MVTSFPAAARRDPTSMAATPKRCPGPRGSSRTLMMAEVEFTKRCSCGRSPSSALRCGVPAKWRTPPRRTPPCLSPARSGLPSTPPLPPGTSRLTPLPPLRFPVGAVRPDRIWPVPLLCPPEGLLLFHHYLSPKPSALHPFLFLIRPPHLSTRGNVPCLLVHPTTFRRGSFDLFVL